LVDRLAAGDKVQNEGTRPALAAQSLPYSRHLQGGQKRTYTFALCGARLAQISVGIFGRRSRMLAKPALSALFHRACVKRRIYLVVARYRRTPVRQGKRRVVSKVAAIRGIFAHKQTAFQ